MNTAHKEKLDLSYQLLLKNRRKFGPFQYTIPSPTSYPYQWLWDSVFHAIVLNHFDPQAAKRELLSLVSHQFENGMIPHMIYWRKKETIDIDWGKKGTSAITQPPMLAYAVWQIFKQSRCKKGKDIKFLEEIYPYLYKFYQYLLTQRDPRGNHLIGIINPDESGEDNSPRFDIPLGLPPKHRGKTNFKRRLKLIEKNKTYCHFDAPFCMKNFFWVKDVPFNSIVVENLRCLANIASILELKTIAAYFSEQAWLIGDAMRELMFDKGVFWSTFGEDYKKIKVLTWAIFAPLFAKIYTAAEAKELVKKHFLNPREFHLPYLVPTVARSEPSFDPEGFWRGPVWMSVNWFIFKGLLNYGFYNEASTILSSSLKLIEKSGFREQFNPLTGEGNGAKDFTWGTLIVDMLKDFSEEKVQQPFGTSFHNPLPSPGH